MKTEALPILERGRLQRPPSDVGALWGAFELRAPKSRYRLLIISSGRRETQPLADEVSEWEHVSVSVIGKKFCPSWEEMSWVKDLFWDDEETVIQFHPPKSEYVNTHGFVLHLWKPPYHVPTPPGIAVGVPGVDRLDLQQTKTRR